MKRQNIVMLSGFVLLLIGAVLLFLLQGPLPMLKQDYQKTLENVGTTRASEGRSEPMKEAAQGQRVMNDGQEIIVTTSVVSKDLHYAAKTDPKNFLATAFASDENWHILSDHYYVEVGLTIKNTENTPKELYMSNIFLGMAKAGELEQTVDISLSNVTQDTSRKDSFKIVLPELAEQEVYLGYVITAEEFACYQEHLYLVPDFQGWALSDPQQLTKIRLAYQED